MAYFKNTQFKGIAPAITPRLLNSDFAQTAKNIDFEHGSLTPILIDSEDSTFSSSARGSVFIYRHRASTGSSATLAKQLEWNDDYVMAVHSPLATDDDDYQRVYWTGEGDYPKMASQTDTITGSGPYPHGAYRLGIPAPTAAPTTTKSGTPSATQEPDSVSYVYTYVSAYGEEGPPSAASTVIDKTDDETVALADLLAFPSGAYNLTKKRIYRSNTGSTSTNFQFLTEITSATTYSDTAKSTELGEVLPTTTWVGPPDDDTSAYPYGPLENLINVGNGILAGHSGNRLCFSEPYLPHAWPVQYRLTIDGTIVGLSATANGVVVLTEAVPFFVSGVDASAMTAMQVDLMQSCINKHSIVDIGEYVLYASPDGLVAVSGTTGEVVTNGLVTPSQWNTDFKPSLIKAFLHEGTYVAFWKDGSNYGGWVFDPKAADNLLSEITISSEVRGGTTDIASGSVFLIVGNKAMKYRGGATNTTATWKSKKYVTEAVTSMSWLSLSAASWPTTSGNAIRVKVYGDGTLIADYKIHKDGNTYVQETTVPGSISNATLRESIMRLPAKVAQEWEIEIETKYEVTEVCLAQSIDEIKNS